MNPQTQNNGGGVLLLIAIAAVFFLLPPIFGPLTPAAPVVTDGLTVLVITKFDPSAGISVKQNEIIKARGPNSLRAFIEKHAARGPDGEPMFRALDESSNPSRDLKVFQDLWDHAKQKRKAGEHWIIAVNGRNKWYEGPLEQSPEAEIARLAPLVSK